MGLFSWLMHRNMKKDAKRIAKEASAGYAKSKSKNPSVSESEIILGMIFDKDALSKVPEPSRTRAKICCESIQGFCYMMALDLGTMKGLINLQSLQFANYMDKELEAAGFPPQSKEQKARILEAMELKIDGWNRITGD